MPWFAVGFIAISAFNSLQLLSDPIVEYIKSADTFLLTMAMTALGMETNIEKFKKAGGKSFVLALIMFVWLAVAGFIFTKLFC